MGDSQRSPFDKDESMGELFGVVHLGVGRVVGENGSKVEQGFR